MRHSTDAMFQPNTLHVVLYLPLISALTACARSEHLCSFQLRLTYSAVILKFCTGRTILRTRNQHTEAQHGIKDYTLTAAQLLSPFELQRQDKARMTARMHNSLTVKVNHNRFGKAMLSRWPAVGSVHTLLMSLPKTLVLTQSTATRLRFLKLI